MESRPAYCTLSSVGSDDSLDATTSSMSWAAESCVEAAASSSGSPAAALVCDLLGEDPSSLKEAVVDWLHY